jgi:glutathione peroxidase
MKLIVMLLTLFATPALALETAATGLHDFTLPSIDGGDLKLSDFKGKTVLLVNTASYCGFTKQYDGLQKLYDSRRDKGLVVLGIPSNDFGQQEPGQKQDIKEFCEVNFAIDFPMTDKLVVKGAGAHPLYKWLKAETGNSPKWNFYKFLIDGGGQAVASFSSLTKPQSKKLTKAIDALLVD